MTILFLLSRTTYYNSWDESVEQIWYTLFVLESWRHVFTHMHKNKTIRGLRKVKNTFS